ncbi:hypothetical protein DACRYDRAFT_93987 [Dacryopinax primogenitus]|uniref:Uncharacterized protein n=1 Tax=Dacryopinax primogenitus (strain DJM 731) TaxID=1858805 RepID=M5G0F1_DACPD|nr:uncharacterized protein DACRYDRAFT_93987 [Dacryopinax primogenitus]EJU03721.1 hypothetical protein DACRYDRAFT_93987 [Dacryopinax primogenitus]
MTGKVLDLSRVFPFLGQEDTGQGVWNAGLLRSRRGISKALDTPWSVRPDYTHAHALPRTSPNLPTRTQHDAVPSSPPRAQGGRAARSDGGSETRGREACRVVHVCRSCH